MSNPTDPATLAPALVVPEHYRTPEYHDRVTQFAEKYLGPYCNFTGDCESETMMDQTLQASAHNLKEHGIAFSFRPTHFRDGGNGLQNNTRGYGKLLGLGYIEEVEAPAEGFKRIPQGCRSKNKVTMIFLTEVGLSAIQGHAGRKSRR